MSKYLSNKVFYFNIKLIMKMYLSDIQKKEVISIFSGLNYGHIVDVEIDEKGNILSFVTQNKKILKKYFSNTENTFAYTEIEKIGEDVILVRV